MHHSGNIHTCQSFFESTAAEEQFLVVETKQMQNGGVKVMGGEDVFFCPKTELIGRTIAESFFDARPGKPAREAKRIMVSPECACLKHGHSTKLCRKDHQSRFEQSPLL